MTEVRTPLAQLQAQVDELSTLRAFWERWGSEWRAVAAVLHRAVETRDEPALRSALDLYQITRAAYQIELKDLTK